MNLKRLIVTVLAAMTLTSCCHNVDCEPATLKFGLVSFSTSDIDTLIFRRFESNSGFRSLKDTMQINNINELVPAIKGDTVLLQTYNSTNFRFQLQAGYDYEIFIPGSLKTVRISDLREEQTKGKSCDISDGNKTCYNPVTGYKIDGQIRNSGYFFIHK